jgi:hypothetical protein
MAVAQRSLTDRIVGVLRLDQATFEEVEADEKATGEAAFIVVASALVAAAGYAIREGGTVQAGLFSAIAELIGWAVYAQFAYLVGTKLFPAPTTHSNWGELARTLGYATSPRFLLLLVAVPGLGGAVRLVEGIWRLVTTVIALRSSLDCTTLRAIVVGIVAVILQGIVVAIILSIVGVALS